VGVEIEEAIDRSIGSGWLGQQPIDRTEAVARTSSSGLTSGSGLTSTAAAAGALRFGIASRRREDRARGLLGGRALGRTRVKFARAVGDGRRRGDADA
jgi:hypothetical protein